MWSMGEWDPQPVAVTQESQRPAPETAETGKVSFKLDQAWGLWKVTCPMCKRAGRVAFVSSVLLG